jgi:hypothetical protein
MKDGDLLTVRRPRFKPIVFDIYTLPAYERPIWIVGGGLAVDAGDRCGAQIKLAFVAARLS